MRKLLKSVIAVIFQGTSKFCRLAASSKVAALPTNTRQPHRHPFVVALGKHHRDCSRACRVMLFFNHYTFLLGVLKTCISRCGATASNLFTMLVGEFSGSSLLGAAERSSASIMISWASDNRVHGALPNDVSGIIK